MVPFIDGVDEVVFILNGKVTCDFAHPCPNIPGKLNLSIDHLHRQEFLYKEGNCIESVCSDVKIHPQSLGGWCMNVHCNCLTPCHLTTHRGGFLEQQDDLVVGGVVGLEGEADLVGDPRDRLGVVGPDTLTGGWQGNLHLQHTGSPTSETSEQELYEMESSFLCSYYISICHIKNRVIL